MGETRRKLRTDNAADALSSLPDSVLISILNLLPTKTAISTSVLSHRWKHLWTQLTHLSFSGPHFPANLTEDQRKECLTKFHTLLASVSHVLHRLTSPKLTKFHLITDFPPNYYTLTPLYDSVVDTCIRLVCSRHPEDISVINHSIFPSHFPLIKIPYTILQCQSIDSLTLGDRLHCDTPPNQFEISLPNLKKLVMCINDSHEKLFKTLFKSLPSLEELYLETMFRERTCLVEIFAPKLKRLTLNGDFTEFDDKFVIDAPKLESLNLSGYSAFYRFVQKPSRLVNAKIDLRMDGTWIDGISCVRFLQLDCSLVVFLSALRDETLPVFGNLTQLTIEFFGCGDWRELLSFLRYCPNFESLVLCMSKIPSRNVEDKIDWAALVLESACLFRKLRVLEVNNIWVKVGGFKFLEYILSVGSVLEKLHVRLCDDGDAQLRTVSEFCHKLFSYPRSSSLCEIKICGQYINASSKGFKDGIYDCQIHRSNVSERQLQHVVLNDTE